MCVVIVSGITAIDVELLLQTSSITATGTTLEINNILSSSLYSTILTAGEDYDEQINSVILVPATAAVGEEICFNITIITDEKLEDDEMFSFVISSDNDVVVFIGPTNGIVTIYDDDSEFFLSQGIFIINFNSIQV